MQKIELLAKVEEIQKLCPKTDVNDIESFNAYYLTVLQFVKTYLGTDTEFYKSIVNYTKIYASIHQNKLTEAKSVLASIKQFLLLNLDFQKSEEYRYKSDIINDFLLQADCLLNDDKYHPAAAAILMGAALEEFLKQLGEKSKLDFSSIKQTIDPIAQKLYENDKITKQDLKDITSWAGLRNDATHGKFDAVNDKKRIRNAIEGINLFMRKYS